MAHTQDNLIALQLVASIALESSKILFPLAIANQSGPAANVAIQLKFIAENISEQELSKIPPEAQTVSTKALHDLLQIAEWPPSKTSRDQPHIEKGPQELRRTLIRLFQNEESKRRVRQSVTKFCKERPNVIQPFASRFTYLSDLLSKNSVESQWNLTGTATHSSPPPRDVYPDQVNKLLIDGVQSHATCMREGHVGSGLQATASPNWHTTKLCLESGFCTEDKRVLFKVVTATSRMTHWQEFAFRVPIMNARSKDAPESQQCKEKFDPSMFTLIANGDACKYLDNPTYARLSIELDEHCHLYQLRDPEKLQYIISGHGLPLHELLKMGDLTVEQKIKLSYTVARAFWQFYNSELMNVRWTSEDILLFRLDQDISPPGDVLLRVFVSFPFGDEGKKSPAESYDEGYYTHRYPRILCLGIILLEIGLGQAIEMGSSSESFSVEHINRVHIKAELKLRELKKTKWDGFRSKACFDEAVENCLESVNFRETTNRQRTQHQSHSVKKPHLSERRDALYRKVVAPLFRLAMVGYQDSDEPRLIRIPNEVRSKSISANDEMLQRSWDEIHHTHSSFLSGHSGNREGFLHHLQVIAGHITRCRRVAKTIKPIRVAILDTGCYKELEFFKDDRRSTRIRGWKDLTTAGSHSATDTFGHGTFMARLLMHVAPIADIYIIRVAENTEDLESHEQDIVKAIIHAGLGPEWKADIISMSFGMSNERKQKCRNISDAIDKVTKERDGSVLFFAAAGNQGIRKENFPASHGDVISIYATNSEGAFLDSNPSQSDDGPKLLGTYGAEIPPSITDEIRTHFPDADLSAGSSIATAIAAGIAAMMLSYVAALPSLLNYTPFETVCAKLHTRSGMQQMLYSMSVLKGYKHYFINPIGFWGERKKDLELLTTVCAAVDKIND